MSSKCFVVKQFDIISRILTNILHGKMLPCKDVGSNIAILSVNIAIGLVRLPEVSDYQRWNSSVEVSQFRSIFIPKRFYEIFKYQDITDNTKTPEKTDQPNYKLHKFRGIIKLLNASLKYSYTPLQELSIDKQMMGTKARFSFIQYIC